MGCFYNCGYQKGFVENVQNMREMITLLVTSKVIIDSDVYIIHNGRILQNDDSLEFDQIYHVIPRLVGGKGGFGSMLRAIGAQIEKTTSREACRDLSGRRMRDVNNEKKLKDWLSKQSDREKEKEEKRKERIERKKYRPQHKFDDPTYVQQKNKVVEDLEDALQRGLEKSKTASASVTSETAGCSGLQRKRKAIDGKSDKAKKSKGWLGLDPDLDLSDLDTSDEDSTESSSESNSNNLDDHHSEESDKPVPGHTAASAPDASQDGQKEEINTVQNFDKKHSLLEILPPPINEQISDDELINLDNYDSVIELEAVGLNRLKVSLMAKGLKCGGTLSQRAERLYSVKGLIQEDIDPTLFAKPSKKK